MKIIKLRADGDPTENAQKLCENIEKELGIKLQIKQGEKEGEIDGHLNTSSNGEVEIYIYEENDAEKINKELERKGAKTRARGCLLSEDFIKNKLNFLNLKE